MSLLLGVIVLVALSAPGPEVEIQRPVPERIGTQDPLEFSVVVRNGDAETPPLWFQVFSSTAPSDKLRGARGVSLEVSTEPGSWRPVQLDGSYGWFGRVDIGRLDRGVTRTFGVRVRSTVETGRIPLEVRLALRDGLGGEDDVLARDGFRVEIVAGTVLPWSSFSAWLFGLGVAIGVLGVVAVLLVLRLVRRRRS